ncbi:MAG: PadR family transcriptional regulator [Acidimicrobiales bacterium]|jgi:DNA-binding PadR family transcriptional regulator
MSPVSLRHGILGLLCGRELSGYDLAREFDLTLANVWSAKHSQIYPELARLAAEGLIEQVGSGPRGRKVYAATDAGREEVVAWLRKGDPGRELRVEVMLQGFFWWLLPDTEVLALLDREQTFHKTQLARYERYAEAADIMNWRRSPELNSQRIMLEAGIRYERGLVEWIDWAREELSRRTQ